MFKNYNKPKRLADKDLALLDDLSKRVYSYVPYNEYQQYMTLMADILHSWPQRALTSSRQSEMATRFGYGLGFLAALTIHMDVSKERKTIKDFLKANQSKQQKLKTEFEKEILQPDYNRGI